jgi:hypothetical protein
MGIPLRNRALCCKFEKLYLTNRRNEGELEEISYLFLFAGLLNGFRAPFTELGLEPRRARKYVLRLDGYDDKELSFFIDGKVLSVSVIQLITSIFRRYVPQIDQ